MLHNLKPKWYSFAAKLRSRNTYPDSLELDFQSILGNHRPVKVAIIDDTQFPWIDALEGRGCKVTYFSDYTKPATQPNQKLKPISLVGHDIIICDIHGVGKALYPGSEGLSVIEQLRLKHPLHVIAAYTGDPGSIYSKLKRQDTLDKVFSRDWQVDDFLLNFQGLLDIFSNPKERWEFIRKRLSHLGVSETKIAVVRRAFVENVIFCQLMKSNASYSAAETRRLMMTSDRNVDLVSLAQFGIKVTEVGSLVSPFFLEAI